MSTYRIILPYACGGIEVENCVVTDGGAPIFNWMRGKDLSYAIEWVHKKRGTIELLERNEYDITD